MNPIEELDLTGLKCPMPIVHLNRHMKLLEVGDEFVALADDPAFCLDVESWCNKTGHELVRQESTENRLMAVIRKK